MALSSMTGFGRGEASVGGIKIEVEVSSVNRKQFDVRVSLPKGLQILEPQIAECIHRRVARGSLTCAVTVEMSGSVRRAGVTVDAELAAAYVACLRRVARRLGLAGEASLDTLLRLPDVVRCEVLPTAQGRLWPIVEKALQRALERLLAMREHEGAALERDLRRRLARLRRRTATLRRLAPTVAGRYRRALLARLGTAGLGDLSRDAAVAKEVVLFADRCDITEELVRLESHFRQADRLLGSREPAWRALDFVCQELFREINTTGSKANDAAIGRHVIAFKAELEAVLEQVQNVE